MYIAVDKNNVICGYCVDDIDFGKLYTTHSIDADITNAFDPRHIPRFMFVDGESVPRTQEEMDKDFNSRPASQPTQEERIKALEGQNETLLQCILEMSEIVYA